MSEDPSVHSVAGSPTGAFADIVAMSHHRDGLMSVLLSDGRLVREHQAWRLAPTSMIERSTHLPHFALLDICTTRGDAIVMELPRDADPAPVRGRETVYLDQNHWSTITNALHESARVTDRDELAAALQLVELARGRHVILPMSFAHMAETCKQVEFEERYRRALTILQLSGGWQLRDPLQMRLFEIEQALSVRYHQLCAIPPRVVTLEPDAMHRGSEIQVFEPDPDLPYEARQAIKVLAAAGGNLDAMLDTQHVPANPVAGWPMQFEKFARFLAADPVGPEMKRRRTHLRFVADLVAELAQAAYATRVTTDQMSTWLLERSEADTRDMPSLGLYREVMHEKLCDPALRWEENDLTDMTYLSASGGYCDHVVGERRHSAYLASAVRRLGRSVKVHRNLRSLIASL
jgi:hypothetical protein